jgi:hypothetical protein
MTNAIGDAEDLRQCMKALSPDCICGEGAKLSTLEDIQ